MRSKVSVLKISLLSFLIALSACTKSPSNSEKNEGDARNFTTDCGVVYKGKLVNPIQAENGTPVTVEQLIGVDIASVRNDNTGESMLVKFHSIDAGNVPATKQFEGRAMLEQDFGRLALFYKANDDCEVDFSGEKARIGQLLKRDTGESYNEALLKGGYAGANAGNSVCGGDFLKTCYEALEEVPVQQEILQTEENQNDNSSIQDLIELLEEIEGNSGGGGSAANIFLWKPSSENDGNLVILHQHGFGVSVKVTYKDGKKIRTETGRDTGPSNGYDATVRFSKSGCSYGKNIKVSVGGKTYKVDNGCNRKEVR
ncbi:MAG: hypothetical protein R3A13_01550 [Bdellovibrionota bacterium]